MIQFFATWTFHLIQMWLLCFVANMYIDKKNRTRGIQTIAHVMFSLVLTLINQLHIPVLNATSGIAIYIVIILLFFQTIWYNTLLLSAIVWGIYAFTETIGVLILSAVQDIQLTTAYLAQDSVMIVMQAFTAILGLAIIMMFRVIVQKRKAEKKLPQNLAVILFPIVSILTIYYIVSTIVDVFSRQTTVYMGIFLGVLMVAVNIASLIGNENVRKRYILQNEIDAMQHQEALTVGLLRQQEEHLKEMNSQAHDFKNHLLCLRALVGKNDADGNPPLQYIDDLLNTVGGVELYTDVHNQALRAILSSTDTACKAKMIDFRCRIDYSDFSFMSFPDLSILFSNALTNAMEACEQIKKTDGRYIDLKILRKGEMLFIQLANSKCNEIRLNHGVIMSTKKQPENHGIGLKNMERVVQKHDGNITTDYDDAEFRLYINLPVENDGGPK